MIVRISNAGQYDIAPADEAGILDLDVGLDAALAAGDEERFSRALAELIAAVRERGRDLGLAEVLPADIVLPSPGSTLSEVRALLDSEAFED